MLYQFHGFACILVVAVMVSAGCGSGSDGPERIRVSGNITYAGKPIENGEIRFESIDGNTPPVGASIREGKYDVVARGGVPVGSHRVIIIGYRSVAKTQSDVEKGATQPWESNPAEQYVPAKYNRQSQLQLDLKPGEDQRTLNYDLHR